MKNIIYVLLLLAACAIFGFRAMKSIGFKQNVKGLIKRAADANTIEIANDELTKVINYLEANNLTSGYTSILYQTPEEDIGFWYKNLKAAQNELQNLNSTSALERTNVLMKLRETLLDSGEKKSKATIPDGLAFYPNNLMWAVLTWLAVGLISFVFIMWGYELEKYEKARLAKKAAEENQPF